MRRDRREQRELHRQILERHPERCLRLTAKNRF